MTDCVVNLLHITCHFLNYLMSGGIFNFIALQGCFTLKPFVRLVATKRPGELLNAVHSLLENQIEIALPVALDSVESKSSTIKILP